MDQESFKNLKQNSYGIVTYTRKSPSNEAFESRVKLLHKMMDSLRSLRNKIHKNFNI